MVDLTDAKRARAWNLLEDISQKDQITKTDELFAYMKTHFFPLRKSDNDISEVNKLLKTPLSETNLNNCSDTIFCVAIIRYGLKDLKLPMVRSKNWQLIANSLSYCVVGKIECGE